MALRIGVDLVDIGRIGRVLERHNTFPTRVFTDKELELAQRLNGELSSQFLAGRFAVKEAVMKAFGTGMTGPIAFTDIETRKGPSGEPQLVLYGPAKELACSLSFTQFQVSISHDANMAVAFVVMI